MRKLALTSIAAILLSGAPAIAGISANDKIYGGDALLIGGTQPGWIDIDGQNRGETDLILIIGDGGAAKEVETIAPGQRFIQSVPKDEVFVIRNASEEEAARVYWHISGYSDLADARLESETD